MKSIEMTSCEAKGRSLGATNNAAAERSETCFQPPVEQNIERTVGYMVEHLDRPLQVANLAAMANVSPSHYFALFKRHTGWSPISFFTLLRMRRAGRLLRGTSMSVKEVAAALGYDDPFYFSRVFKSIHDVAPSEYRLLPSGMNSDDWNESLLERPRAQFGNISANRHPAPELAPSLQPT